MYTIWFLYFRGFDKLYERCVDFLLHGLAYQPISQQLCCSNKPNCNTLLLYGSGSTAGGAGKTTLAHAICNTLGKHPTLAHISVIECVSLRGETSIRFLVCFKALSHDGIYLQLAMQF